MQAEEYSLIEQCRGGNSEAYAILVERYQEMVYNVACRMIGDRDAAHDISQESFLSAYDGLKRFRSDSKFSTWLYRITVNKCRDYLRGRKPDVLLDEVSEILPSKAPDPQDLLYRKQLGQTLQTALGALPEDYREVIVLKHIGGLDYKEMESILGVSANALKVRTYRAREMLKKFLLEAGVSNG
ncbi:MAG: sigma-70 family RNA polymerase sigma factor [Nitrospirae bacterium]|nr:sigma-70 family RNA polymerase sigma factor [Nitrospirota bacterium]